MIRSIIVAGFLLITSVAYSQSFPNAEKQPRLKESRTRNKRYAKQAHRRHIKRGTAYLQFNCPPSFHGPVCILTGNRRLLSLV